MLTEYLDGMLHFRKSIDRAAELLLAGELVAFPTETVYGLGAVVNNDIAVKQIFTVKQRPSDNPLIVHLSETNDIHLVAKNIPDNFYILAHHFFPGPLTVVLQKSDNVSNIATGGLETVAVRVPKHDLARELIKTVGAPIVAPSANISGRPSPTSAQHVVDDLGGMISAVVDGGKCEFGIESTVVALSNDAYFIARQGIVAAEEIVDVLGGLPMTPEGSAENPISPGMKYRHYAPRIPVAIVQNLAEAHAVLEDCDTSEVKVLSNLWTNENHSHSLLSTVTLYAEFRAAEKSGFKKILVVLDDNIRKNKGLMNRILKAGGE